PIINNLQNRPTMILSSHLELLPVFQQLEEHCMKQVIIVELLSENHTFQSKPVETDWNGAKDTKNGQMSNGKKSSGVMNLGLHCFKVMAELDSQRRNMMLTMLFQQLSMVVEG